MGLILANSFFDIDAKPFEVSIYFRLVAPVISEGSVDFLIGERSELIRD